MTKINAKLNFIENIFLSSNKYLCWNLEEIMKSAKKKYFHAHRLQAIIIYKRFVKVQAQGRHFYLQLKHKMIKEINQIAAN